MRKHLTATANMQVLKGRVPKTLATLEALYAYAMWAGTDFYSTKRNWNINSRSVNQSSTKPMA
tara:strand:- start:1343 stop:1531 length:189 start_codon:yes stop_codon:yes gene_type:complete